MCKNEITATEIKKFAEYFTDVQLCTEYKFHSDNLRYSGVWCVAAFNGEMSFRGVLLSDYLLASVI